MQVAPGLTRWPVCRRGAVSGAQSKHLEAFGDKLRAVQAHFFIVSTQGNREAVE